PYGDLEVYSDNPNDISTMEYDDFVAAYSEIIKRGASRLKNDRFAVFVVGDIRDKKGIYRNFVDDTKKAFLESGLHFYNEIVLI
ncbi:chromosome partitioning protein ParB, partial [Salinicoccus roseus]